MRAYALWHAGRKRQYRFLSDLMLRAPEVLIAGSGSLAKDTAMALSRHHRRVVWIDQLDRIGKRMHPDATLIVTAEETQPPGNDRNQTWEQLWAALDARLQCRRTLPRILLLSEAGASFPAQLPASAQDIEPQIERLVLEQSAARLLFTRWPLHFGCDPLFGQQVHWLICGRTPLADALLLHMLRIAHYSEKKPVITLVSDAPEHWHQNFTSTYPGAEAFSRLHFCSHDDPVPGDEAAVSGVIICAPPSGIALEFVEFLALSIVRQQRISPIMLVDVGDAEPGGRIEDWNGQILAFSQRRMVLRPEVLLDAQDDQLAQVIHEHYRDSIAGQGRNPDTEPSSQPWSTLDDSYRSANRHQADHLWAKLAITDCRAVTEDLVESFAFAPEEVERLAVIEHARWAADRYLDGWSYAPIRDNASKHHPQLIAYNELSGPMKDLDRFAVRLVPALLARSGLGLMRMLIVGIREGWPLTAAGADGGNLRRRVDQVLRRLRKRYPDRGLVIATTLADPASRLFAKRARQLADASLFLLVPRLFDETLAAQPDHVARRELLELAVHAERRISLPGAMDLEQWLRIRAEILVEFDSDASERTADQRATSIRKHVRMGARHEPEWNFEY